jgi:hypothetical protein
MPSSNTPSKWTKSVKANIFKTNKTSKINYKKAIIISTTISQKADSPPKEI